MNARVTIRGVCRWCQRPFMRATKACTAPRIKYCSKLCTQRAAKARDRARHAQKHLSSWPSARHHHFAALLVNHQRARTP